MFLDLPYVSSALKPVRLLVCTHRLTPQCWLSRSWWRISCKLSCGGCLLERSSSANSSCVPSKPSWLASSGKDGWNHQLCPCTSAAARASSVYILPWPKISWGWHFFAFQDTHQFMTTHSFIHQCRVFAFRWTFRHTKLKDFRLNLKPKYFINSWKFWPRKYSKGS